METSPIRFQEKSVIIHRDENGFGLRVGGQNPVIVDCVHENGAAWKAGVRKDDRIIKVNGTLVKSYDHQRVVQMIQNCTPFVNLTLHSPEHVATADCSSSGLSYTLGVDQSNGCMIAISTSGNTDSQNTQANNLQIHHNYSHPHTSTSLHLNQRHHPHSTIQGNLNWLLDIGDDLFQDNHQKQPMQHNQQQQKLGQQHQEQSISISQQSPGSGVSKLVVSGPNPLSHPNVPANSRLSKSQSNNNTRDNPYYYYKTAQQQSDKSSDETTPATNNPNQNGSVGITSSSSTASLLGNDSQAPKVSSSMVRSRSSSKMSTRSTTSKYAKARNLRTRLVEDLRSLAIPNSQTTPSSLSTSPSSSDLSDCDDTEHLAGLTIKSPNLSSSPNSSSTITMSSAIAAATLVGVNMNQQQPSQRFSQQQQQRNQQQQQQLQLPHSQQSVTFNISDTNKPTRITTRRLEIIRELVDTEKTHTEKLKQLNDLLYKPIKAENLIPQEQLKMVFSCHKTLFKIHRQIYKKLLAAQLNYSEQPQHQQPQHLQEPLVGKALIEIFEGELGKRLEKAASAFCACQSTNTELLNRITRKDTKSGEFLAQVANQQMLGRLGIKDLLASCFQRLTKYPLLLDNLLKATPNSAAPGGLSSVVNHLGMMHSKSLSEGSIAKPSSSVASVVTNGGAGISKNNNGNCNQVTISAIDELSQESRRSANESTVSSEPTVPVAQISTSPSALLSAHYESIDENQVSDCSSANTTASSVESSTTTATSALATSALNDSTMTSLCDEYAYERFCIERALQCSRQILIHVNEAVNNAIAQSKLREIWRKTDKNPSLPVIDIDSQQLLHEGSLTLRLNRRQFEVYVLLLTHYLVILTRENQEKYKLKYFTSDGKTNTLLSPIFNIDEHLVTRDSATDENGFYLLCKRKDDERIYEFASQSPLERAKWKEKIHMAQLYNFAIVPDDDNTLTRYTELISLTNTGNTPNNIEHNPTS